MGNLIVKHRIVLDLARRGAQVTVPVTVADTLSHQIIVTLRNGTETVELPDGTRAAIAIHNNAGGSGVLDSCIVDHVNNAVIYTFSAAALSVAGNIACDITVFDKDGAALGTPTFNLFVEDTGADVTAEQLIEALKGEHSAWQLVQDFYISVEKVDARMDEKIEDYDKKIKVYGEETYAPYQNNSGSTHDAIPILQKDGTYSKFDLDPSDTADGSVAVRGANGLIKGGTQTTTLPSDTLISRGLAERLFLENCPAYTDKGTYSYFPATAQYKSGAYALGDYVYSASENKYYVWVGGEWATTTTKPSGKINTQGVECPLVIGTNGYVKMVHPGVILKNATLVLSVNPSTFLLTAGLKVGTSIITQASVDLPLEEMITDISTVDEDTIRLTLKSGKSVDVSVEKLVSGLATKDELKKYLMIDNSESDVNRVYAVDTEGEQKMLECSEGRRPRSLAIRTKESNNFGVGHPTNDMHCVPLGFGDVRYGFRNETRALQAARIYNISKSDIEHQIVEGDRSPISSGAIYNAFADLKQVINGRRLETSDTAGIAQTDYGEYEIYGGGATVTYNGNSYSGRLHQFMLYTTKLDDGNTGTRYRHIFASEGTLGIPQYNIEYGTLSTDIKIVADGLSFLTVKKAISGVEKVPVATPELVYELSADGTYYTVTGVSSTPTDTDIVIASHIDGIPVTTIGNRALMSIEDMTSLVIPDTVTTIKEYGLALSSPKLAYLKIPHSVTTLEQYAICAPYTKYIDFLANVSVIPKGCFRGNNSICDFSIAEEITEIGLSAFENCIKLTAIRFPKSIQTLGWTLFGYCKNLKDIYVPWSEGEVAYAPWGAVNATIHYNSEV